MDMKVKVFRRMSQNVARFTGKAARDSVFICSTIEQKICKPIDTFRLDCTKSGGNEPLSASAALFDARQAPAPERAPQAPGAGSPERITQI
jgi:hypothetical protein